MNIWKSGIMGVVVGDALGCPVQFESRAEVARHPVKGMRGFGTFNLPKGSWTDDGSLTLALLESIRRTGGIDYADIMDNFLKWMYDGEFTPYGYSFDIGSGTMCAIRRYRCDRDPHRAGGREENNNGNGGLMRIMPAVLYCIEQNLPEAMAIGVIHKVGSLTHAHIRSNIACGLYYFMAAAILRDGGTIGERLQAGLDRGFEFYEAYLDDCGELEHYARLRDCHTFGALDAAGIRSGGYVVHTLEAVVWSLLNGGNFRKTLLKAVNLGYDTDTVGAIAGGLAGLFYGYEDIPKAWLRALKKRRWIEGLCEAE